MERSWQFVCRMKILLVDDSERLLRSIYEGLRRSGYAVDKAKDGEAALDCALAVEYDAIVLDLMLPKLDGLEVLQAIRDYGVNTNVLILSAKSEVRYRVQSFELGADDYLVKPFAFEELVARLRALVRRRYDQRSPLIRINGIELNLAQHRVSKGNKELPLTPNELRLLEILALNRGRVMSQDRLQDHLCSSDQMLTRNAVEAHISALRKKLRDEGEPDVVKTRRGFGYYIDVA